MITLAITKQLQQEMADLLLEFGERHDLSYAEVAYCVSMALCEHGYQIAQEERHLARTRKR